MKLTKLSLIALACLGFSFTAQANEILLTSSKSVKEVTYQIVHKNQSGQPVFEPAQSLELTKSVRIPVELKEYDLAGITIVSVNGHTLPATVNQFAQPRQCSLATDKTRRTGALEFTLSEHEISCSTYGGIFG